jgi:hypothetical protein
LLLVDVDGVISLFAFDPASPQPDGSCSSRLLGEHMARRRSA